jgi:2-oxoglutarate ferredoxin oxidoreductase subunit beta
MIPRVAEKPEHPLGKYVYTGWLLGEPRHIFCPGCGYGTIAQALTRVFIDEKLDGKKYPFVIGIGCYSALPAVLPGYSVMVLHGRVPAVATGMKLANPELKPIGISGDGDLLAIGTSHFLHACRRNVDMLLILLHNNVYGMTGGQVAPTTPTTFRATTAPYGYAETPFDACELAIVGGATYVARWSSIQVQPLVTSIKKALKRKGLSFIEIVSPCPTYFGRKNKMAEPIDVFRWIKDKSVKIEKAKGMSKEELAGKYLIGEFVERERPELSEMYRKLITAAQEGK